ncbi:MAG TPA: addiction module protein [Thermoanaerobaculia bacterium]|nr:addiction module protein [Thermoanaerobaculia bacterium]
MTDQNGQRLSKTLTKDEIFDLPVSELLHLIETLWDSITPEELPVPERHQRALDAALADYKRNPGEGHPWHEVRDELFPKR